jgi:hypothetical protein
MELKIGKLLLCRKGFQLIVLYVFLQGIILGAYYAATEGGKDVPISIIFLFLFLPLISLWKTIKKEISVTK